MPTTVPAMSVRQELEHVTALVMHFLESKRFLGARSALAAELAMALDTDDATLEKRNNITSELENLLGLVTRQPEESAHPISDVTPPLNDMNAAAEAEPHPGEEEAMQPTAAVLLAAGSLHGAPTRAPKRIALFELAPFLSSDEAALRAHYGKGDSTARAIFHDPPPMSQGEMSKLAHISLPVLYNPLINALEDSRDLPIEEGTVLVGQYRVIALIGKGTFSRVFQCLDLKAKRMVSVKVLRNDKDCLDAGLGEVKVLAHLASHDDVSSKPVLRLRDYFYYREHLFIVTELLRDSLFQFYKYVHETDERGGLHYFRPSAIAAIATQLLTGLSFVHAAGLVHCDIKPENVCIVSASKRLVKIIDFGSSVCRHDTTNSYVQSRWYRAPEVMLGLRWDSKIDMWSLGCLLAELMLGHPLFQGGTVAAVLASQQAVLGPHPSTLLQHAPRDTLRMYFAPNGCIYALDPKGVPSGAYELVPERIGLGKLLRTTDGPLLSFLSSLLEYAPQNRMSASEALAHPFITAHLAKQQGKEQAKEQARVGGPSHGERGRRRSEGGAVAALRAAARARTTRKGSSSDSHGDTAARDSETESDGGLSSSSEAYQLAGYVSGSSFTGSLAGSECLTGSAEDSEEGTPQRSHGKSSKGKQGARGPGVPEGFRNQLATNDSSTGRGGDRRNSHDWKSRLVRLLAPASTHGAAHTINAEGLQIAALNLTHHGGSSNNDYDGLDPSSSPSSSAATRPPLPSSLVGAKTSYKTTKTESKVG